MVALVPIRSFDGCNYLSDFLLQFVPRDKPGEGWEVEEAKSKKSIQNQTAATNSRIKKKSLSNVPSASGNYHKKRGEGGYILFGMMSDHTGKGGKRGERKKSSKLASA